MDKHKERIEKLKKEIAQLDRPFTNQRVVMTSKRPQGYVPKNRIATGNDKARRAVDGNYRAFIAFHLMERNWDDALRALALPPLPPQPEIFQIAKPYVNHGRWVADCPDPDCAGCEVVEPTDPVFMCLSCGNLHTQQGNRVWLLTVDFPVHNIMQAATRALLKRPRIFRNWAPETESVQDLLEENEKNM